MQRMKQLAAIALCLAACVPAQAADRVAQGRSAGSQPPARALPPQVLQPRQGLQPQPGLQAQQAPPPKQEAPAQRLVRPSWIAPQLETRPAASVAFLFTDDHDSTRLPAFATRTTPLPTRFMRLGVEWSF
jgi:hypothetical protein